MNNLIKPLESLLEELRSFLVYRLQNSKEDSDQNQTYIALLFLLGYEVSGDAEQGFVVAPRDEIMRIPTFNPRQRWINWTQLPRYKRAGDIARRLLAIFLIGGAGFLYNANTTTGLNQIVAEALFFLPFQTFALLMALGGFALFLVSRPSIRWFVFFTFPYLIYSFYAVTGWLLGRLNSAAAFLLGIMYSILLVLYWGTTDE